MGVLYTILLVIGGAFLIFIAVRRFFSVASQPTLGPSGVEILEIKILRSGDEETDFKISALAAEQLFASLHGLLREDKHMQEYFSLEMVSDSEKGLRFMIVVPREMVKFVEGQVYAQYPKSQINVIEDYAAKLDFSDQAFEIATLKTTKEDFFPIKSFRDFEVDPMSATTTVLSQAGADETIALQYLFRPVGDTWQGPGHGYVEQVREGTYIEGGPSFKDNLIKGAAGQAIGIAAGVATGLFKSHDPNKIEVPIKKPEIIKLTQQQELQISSVEDKLAKMGYEVEIRILSAAPNIQKAEEKLRLVTASLQQFSVTGLNTFATNVAVNKNSYLEKFKSRLFEPDNSFILNTEELASVFHLPSGAIDTPNISWVYSRKTEPPSNLPKDDCVYIGETVFRSKKVKFGLSEGDDRIRHMYVIGKSGTGKSTLFSSMISQDIAKGYGVGMLDPHGETIESVLQTIPDNRVDDVIYVDPSDTEKPLGINLMQIDDPSQKNLLASGLVAAIKQHFDFSWGPRLEYLLNYSILTLLDVPGTTMLGITRLLEDPNYQKFILHHVKDPVVKRFWEKEYKEFKGNQRLVTEAIAPIQNKVNRFLASSTIRNVLGQGRSTLDIWDAMNNKKILLINLSKGKIGQDNANLLGALLVSRIQFYALQRAHIPHNDRSPFYLYVDEFQNFATGSFEEILSESRKYKLGLYLTHQFTAQLPEQLLKAVYGNVGTIAAFSLGAPDARALASEFAPYFDDEDIISLRRFEIYIKMMINGMTSLPFSGKILLPWVEEEAIVPKTDNVEKVKQLSRDKYGVDREYVEGKIAKWIETDFDKGMAIALENRRKNKENNIK
ncbi:type IV secretory system conjugative DNA transfer family protein [Patescibacteria group bacterium]